MSTEPKKFGLVLSKKAPASTTPLPVASVFGDADDSDNEIANEKDADKKFHMKYGSNKTRDQRAVEEALAADPDVYEYDSIHDDLVSKRNAKTEEQKEADKNREPKYAHKIVLATQKRAMEKLMVDERKQAKEREAEGEGFKDKDAFVTGAYKKQIEERERIRKELEEQDRMDGRLKIEDQHFWQANLNRRLLDDLTDDKPVIVKKEIIVEEKSEQDKKLFQELKPGLNQPKSLTKPKRSPTPERSRSSRRDRDDHHRKRRRSSERRHHQRSTSKDKSRSRRRHDSSASSRSPSPRSKENNEKRPEKPKSDKEILYERLEKIKEILKQRNSESEIFMARQRYLQRKQNGEIRAPI